ncbi:hypothetical protein HDZ31DRAFT_79311 [Schizophyllum fasciatum]
MTMEIQQPIHNEAAINCLPDELLSVIFEAIVRSASECAELLLVVLERICRRWRSVLMATPTLWTLMRAYLMRSGAYSDDVGELVPLLRQHARRIRSLSITGRTVEGLHDLTSSLRDLAAPELRYLQFALSFHTPPLAIQQSLMPMTVFAGGTPNLTRVDLQLSGALDVFPLHIPETTISLRVTPYPATIASSGLHSAFDIVHNLTEIYVHGELVPVNPDAYGMDVIEAPQLRRLTQSVGRRRTTSFWPAILRAPMLEHITLLAREQRDLEGFLGDAPASFEDHAFPEQPMLHSFTIASKQYKGHCCDNAPWRVCEALRVCTHLHNVLASVRHLTLVNICRGGKVLADLLARTPDGQRMPELGVVDVSSPSMDWERLCHMLDYRRDAGFPLRVIGLTPEAVEEGADHLCSRVEIVRQFFDVVAVQDPFACRFP